MRELKNINSEPINKLDEYKIMNENNICISERYLSSNVSNEFNDSESIKKSEFMGNDENINSSNVKIRRTINTIHDKDQFRIANSVDRYKLLTVPRNSINNNELNKTDTNENTNSYQLFPPSFRFRKYFFSSNNNNSSGSNKVNKDQQKIHVKCSSGNRAINEGRSEIVSIDKKPRRRLTITSVECYIEPSDEKLKRNRTRIISYEDPAMKLIDRERGSVIHVSTTMIKKLFPNANYFCIFGCPADEKQQCFGLRPVKIETNLSSKINLPYLSSDRQNELICGLKGLAYACRKGLKLNMPNQDDFFILEVDDWAIYGVFDGHGAFGHSISQFVQKTLPFLIISDPEFENSIKKTLARAFWRVHHLIEALSLQLDSNMDISLSGTTATVVVRRDNILTVAHVGDSRAVLCKEENTSLKAIDLTEDHKPNNTKEKERILKCGGEVRIIEEDAPARVFLKNRSYPGLAMSRAIGDSVAGDIGVIPEPDIAQYTINDSDLFLVLATDGVWEFINSQECIEMVNLLTPTCAVELICKEAMNRWINKEDVVDDISCIYVKLRN